jgi:hypothetical protein
VAAPGHNERDASDNVRQKFTSLERDNKTGLDYFDARYPESKEDMLTIADLLPRL